MKKLTDQELDSAFKNAAEGYQPAFDAAAWEAMNAKLDAPKPSLWKRWMPLTLLGLLIFSTGIWVGTYFTTTPSLTRSQTESTSKEPVRIQEDQAAATPETPAARKSLDEVTLSDVVSATDRRYVVSTRKKSNTFVSSQDDQDSSQRKLQKEDSHNKVMIITEINNPVDETIFLEQQENRLRENDNLLTEHLTDSILHTREESAADSTQSDDKGEEKKVNLPAPRTFFLRLLASPDFSSINYTPVNSVGSNYSILVDYQLTNRLSISTGAIWSMKTYSSDDEFTYGAYTADRMAGDCRVLDIPLNIYYQFPSRSRFSFYSGLGLSSYIMLEEDYTYIFDTPSGSRDFSSYYEGKNNEWFKVLNVSLGVQYQFAPRWQLQVEPFLKAPLAGVGEWEVTLSSMGMFMGLKYKIN